jgi:hypothetical protein
VTIVQIPGVSIHRGFVLFLAEGLVLLCEVQSAEDKPRLDVVLFEDIQVLFNVLYQG